MIEIIVSLAIFAIVAVVAIGALLRIMDANKKAQTLQSAISNLSYALESMSREMRTGGQYTIADGVLTVPSPLATSNTHSGSNSNGSVIAFRSSQTAPATGGGTCNLTYAYRFNPLTNKVWTLEKARQSDCNTTINSGSGSSHGDFAPVISDSIVITGYYIQTTGISGGSGSDRYPTFMIRISGYVGVRELEKTYFDVQTAVSARIP